MYVCMYVCMYVSMYIYLEGKLEGKRITGRSCKKIGDNFTARGGSSLKKGKK